MVEPRIFPFFLLIGCFFLLFHPIFAYRLIWNLQLYSILLIASSKSGDYEVSPSWNPYGTKYSKLIGQSTKNIGRRIDDQADDSALRITRASPSNRTVACSFGRQTIRNRTRGYLLKKEIRRRTTNIRNRTRRPPERLKRRDAQWAEKRVWEKKLR